jgi:alkylation response protein AidB-like acyl-CoA dehydrogenase
MDFRDTPEEAAFRQEVRDFLRKELPPELAERDVEWGMLGGGGSYSYREQTTGWRKKLAQRGWIVPAWPKEYGGAGMSVIEQFIFNEEMARANAPTGSGIGTGWAGPTIIVYGSEEQKREHLPPILSGEATWCQGFSEPEAGSDLASLRTRAVRDGDEYVINGQKIWTSLAQIAQWMILLARTDPEAPKHKGISYFLLDMKSPGITIRPLVNILGNADFTEVFFDNVRIPRRNLLGEENRGWYIAAATLDFERSGIGTAVGYELIVNELLRYAREEDEAANVIGRNPAVRYELADRYVETQVAQTMSYRVVSMQARGVVPNIESSVNKLYSSELEQRIAATGVKLLGLYGQLNEGTKWAPLKGKVARMYLRATAITIGGGTSEIQRNIMAQRGLGLPRH